MKLGTLIKMQDGRVGTVVYNSLIGVGIKWGVHYPDPEDFEGTDGNTVRSGAPDDWQWNPDALLREPFPTCVDCGFQPTDCVGSSFEVLE